MENCFLVSYDRLCTPEVPTENVLVLVLAIGKRESGAGKAVEESACADEKVQIQMMMGPSR